MAPSLCGGFFIVVEWEVGYRPEVPFSLNDSVVLWLRLKKPQTETTKLETYPNPKAYPEVKDSFEC